MPYSVTMPYHPSWNISRCFGWLEAAGVLHVSCILFSSITTTFRDSEVSREHRASQNSLAMTSPCLFSPVDKVTFR